MKTYIIGEAGVNHNGSFKNAVKMIKIAKKCGVNAIKFQAAIPELGVSKKAPKAKYQKSATNENESQLKMLSKIHLPLADFIKIKKICKNYKIDFLCSAFDEYSAEFLNKIGLNCFKIPSGEINNIPYLNQIGKYKKNIILSTGMSTLREISTAITALINAGTIKKKIILLHCVSEYPTLFENVNLNLISKLKSKFGLKTGFSDHTIGIEASIAAVAKGATVIEKHFTLNKNLKGPDHSMSLEPAELKNLVDSIRNVEKSFGKDSKHLSLSEARNKKIVRRSLVALTNINQGEVYTSKNLGLKRPGTGLPPIYLKKIIGKKANKNYTEDDLIKWKKS